MNKKFARYISLALVLVLAMTLFGSTISAQGDRKVLVDAQALGASDVPTLDPSLATDTSSIQVLIETTPGLSRVNEVTLATEPGMATWEVSEDGLVYTFSILPEVPWVFVNDAGEVEMATDADGNVRYVTAEDFAFGIRRSIGGELGSYYGGIMSDWVENGRAVYNGEMPVEDLGVEAIDTYTLQITAARPAAFLPTIFGMWQAYAQPAWVIEEFGDFWYEAENFQSYGPFVLAEWLHGESVTLVKNPFWPGTDNIPVPAIDEVQLMILDQSAAFANFEAGTADVVPAPSAELDRIKADAELSQALYIGPYGCTYMFPFNTAKAPMDDVRVRRALSMTIDRQSLIDNVLKGEQVPAYFFARESLLAAAPLAENYPEYALTEDVEAAQALLQEYLDERGITMEEMEPITLWHNESEGHARIAQAIQQMWTDALGINVQIQTQEWGTYLETIKSADAPQTFRYGWCLDYPDAHNFLFDVFHSSVRELGISWDDENSARFDALVEQAMVEEDMQTRTDLYAEAEYILTNESAVIAPVYFYTTLRLYQPWVDATYTQFGQDYYEKWDIDLTAKP
ncbi:MAG: peptide ABC transporter substrate-binding protein [Anaerolineae bacterium]|nr:peptide ABC transporter substrate-binding protein [Anaerolineae bacterium]